MDTTRNVRPAYSKSHGKHPQFRAHRCAWDHQHERISFHRRDITDDTGTARFNPCPRGYYRMRLTGDIEGGAQEFFLPVDPNDLFHVEPVTVNTSRLTRPTPAPGVGQSPPSTTAVPEKAQEEIQRRSCPAEERYEEARKHLKPPLWCIQICLGHE